MAWIQVGYTSTARQGERALNLCNATETCTIAGDTRRGGKTHNW